MLELAFWGIHDAGRSLRALLFKTTSEKPTPIPTANDTHAVMRTGSGVAFCKTIVGTIDPANITTMTILKIFTIHQFATMGWTPISITLR